MAAFSCGCGRKLRFDDDRISVRCPACGSVISADVPAQPRTPSGRVAPSPTLPRSAGEGARPAKTWSRRYAFLAIAILPLLLPIDDPPLTEDSFALRIEQTLEK